MVFHPQRHIDSCLNVYRVPPNCRFELDDIEQPWTWRENSADFIYSRDLILAIRDFPKLIDQSYRQVVLNLISP